MIDDLQALAREYASRLPAEDAAMNRTLAMLCDRVEPLKRLADRLPTPEADEAIALILAVQYSLQAVLRVGRAFVIKNAANSTGA